MIKQVTAICCSRFRMNTWPRLFKVEEQGPKRQELTQTNKRKIENRELFERIEAGDHQEGCVLEQKQVSV